jgi:hypothetical protein
MKTTFLSSMTGASLLVAAILASSALAGPGPQYWAFSNRSQIAAKPATPATAMHGCPGAACVAATAQKPSWTNGRGPLTAVSAGTQTVCQTCPVATVVTTNAWPNGRGPSVQTESLKTGVPHACTSCGPMAMK